jgi:hypothetical protein
MAWWAYCYVVLLSWVGVCSVRGSAKRHGRLATTLEVVTSIAWPFLVLAYFAPPVGDLIDRLVGPLYAVALTWTMYTLWRDFRWSAMRPQLNASKPGLEYAVALVFAAAIVIPVVWLGAVVVAQHV